MGRKESQYLGKYRLLSLWALGLYPAWHLQGASGLSLREGEQYQPPTPTPWWRVPRGV